MSSASYRDFIIKTDPELAAAFGRAWWGTLPQHAGGGRRLISLFQMPSNAATFYALDSFLGAVESVGVSELVYPDHTRTQHVYHSCATLKAQPKRGRGKASDIDVSPGAWLDLDVKDESFTSHTEILTFIWDVLDKKHGLKPSHVVNSGGGAHLYWLTREPLDVKEMREGSQRLRQLVMRETGYKVDDVSDPTRVLRLPGTVWWPSGKGAGARAGRQVTTQWLYPDLTYDFDVIRRTTQDAYAAYEAGREALLAERDAANRTTLAEWDPESLNLGGGWALRTALERARQVFPTRVSWESILVPAGWSKHGDPDDEGRQEWTRPHSPGEPKVNPRSLVTGWEGSPHVASLLSDSPKTGLLRLHDAGIALTKLNVMAELHFEGSVNAALLAFIAAEKKAGR